MGATASSFTIPVTALADSGNYSARVWNNSGAVISTNVTLIVVNGLLPQIIVPPFDRVAPTNTSVAFNVVASGTPAPSYQWFFSAAPLAGATASSFTRASVNASHVGQYFVVVSNTAGAVTSAPVVLALPNYTTNTLAHDEFTGAPVGWADAEPNPRTNGLGAFNAAAGNYGNRRFSATPLLGDVWILYTFKMETPADSYYTTSLGNTAGSVQWFNTGFDSSFTQNGMHSGSVFTTIPNTNLQTFLYKVTSTSNSTAYQLWAGPGLGLGLNTAAPPLATGTIGQAVHGVNSYYRSFGSTTRRMLIERVVVGRTPDAVLPASPPLPPAIAPQPANASVNLGVPFTLTVGASGSAPLVFQWHFNNAPLPGANAASYAVAEADATNDGNYFVVVSNPLGSATSAVARVTVNVASSPPGAGGLNLVPWPTSLVLRSGTLTLSAASRVVAGAPALLPLASVVSNELYQVHGLALAVAQGAASDGDIELQLDNTLNGERHLVDVANRAVVRGSNYFAVAAGTTTLLQASRLSSGAVTIPRFVADDTPAVAIRAVMLDLARRFHSPESLHQAVDLCRHYKLNYLHLHFNDSESFMFPLTNAIFAPVMSRTAAMSRPSYTRAQMIALETYARDRGVFIQPELEVPGHSRLLIEAQPGLYEIDTDPALLVGVQSNGDNGYRPSHAINIADPACVSAVSNMLVEMCQVFSSTPYVHIGCDEADFTPWSSLNPEFQAAYAREGIPFTNSTATARLFSKFIVTLRAAALTQGKGVMVWETGAMHPSAEVDVPRDILVQPFDSFSPGSFVNDGFKLINAAWRPLYVVNSMYSNRGPAKPHDRVNPPVSQIYAWHRGLFAPPHCESPDPNWRVVAPANVLGTQLNSWEQDETMEVSTLRRRAAAMSERSWNPALGASFANFTARLDVADPLLDRVLSPVLLTPTGLDDRDERIFMNTVLIGMELAPAFAARGDLRIRFSTNALTVTAASPLYTGGLTLADDSYVMAAAFTTNGVQVGRAVREWYRREFAPRPNLALGKPVTATGGSNPGGAVDGSLQRCTNSWNTGTPNAGAGGIALTVDLLTTQAVHRVALLFGSGENLDDDNLGGANKFRIEVSTNNATWTTVLDRSANTNIATIRGEEHTFAPALARYVRIVLLSHTDAGRPMILTELQVFAGATSYDGINDPPQSLTPWPGRHTAFLTRSATLNLDVMSRLVNVADGTYEFYEEATGRRPGLLLHYNGLATVAEVTNSCGAGCGYLGATGIELSGGLFNLYYTGVRDQNQYDQTLFYEFGRNFYIYDGKIRYSENIADPIAAPAGQSGWIGTGYAVHMRFAAMEALGVAGAPFGPWTFPQFRASVEAMVDVYQTNLSLSFTNTLLVNTPPPGTQGSTTDFYASFMLRLAKWYGRDFHVRAYREIGARPNAVTTQDAVDNWILGCCHGTRRNLTHLFTTIWRIPMSAAAEAEAQTRWGAPVTVFP